VLWFWERFGCNIDIIFWSNISGILRGLNHALLQHHDIMAASEWSALILFRQLFALKLKTSPGPRSGSYLVYQLQAPWAFWAMSSLRMVHVLGLDVPSRRLSDRYHQLEMQAPLVPNPTNASQLAMNPTVNARGYGGVIITKASCQAWRGCSLRTKWE
jgi:hypothetical protein